MRKVQISRALTRPTLILGCERKPLIALGMLCAVVAMTMTLKMIMTAIFLFITGVAVLRRIAKKDPILMSIYLRHIKFRKFYMSKPHIHRFF